LAQLDLKEIERFIAKGSVKYSKIEKRLIIGAIEKLLDFPELGTPFIYKDISQDNSCLKTIESSIGLKRR